MQEIQKGKFEISPAQGFAFAFLAFCALAAALIGSFPLQLSIVTIFLFAGFHNFMEFRYFVARMPLRWGKSRAFYTVGIGGVLGLTVAYLAIYFLYDNWLWSLTNVQALVAVWNTLFVLWLGLLFYLRGRQKPKTDWSLAIAAAFLLASLAWLAPNYWSLTLVYLHPFIALWFVERQIRRTRKEWLAAYHFCLASIPFFLIVLWLALGGQANLPENTPLFSRISQHAGGAILPGVSTHLLVAAHVFLETIHYAAWILLIPLVDRRAVPWKLKEIPLASNKQGFPKLATAVLIVGVGAVLALWLGFSVDYATTRDVYFAFAIAHVLAEFPFLVKML
ncbi:MAG TPA: hypothetical protein VK400_07980 [Pyrinomonadaceae bacterium]|nr:hypothetical protein [Pyrinomonadaceae bacterium]